MVLVGFDVRIVLEQQEVAEKHAADEPHLLIGDFERALVARLDRLTQQALQSVTSSFKTPTLREVARISPFMQDGSFATLEDVIAF